MMLSFNVFFYNIDACPFGWYIYDFLKKILQSYNSYLSFTFSSYVPNPVLVIIDVQPKELGIPTKAYCAVEEVKEVNFISYIFFKLNIIR